jgi:hypothetical protein
LALSSSPAQLGTRAGARASARFSTAAKAKLRNILKLFLIRTLKRQKGRDATLINPRLNFSSWRDEWSHHWSKHGMRTKTVTWCHVLLIGIGLQTIVAGIMGIVGAIHQLREWQGDPLADASVVLLLLTLLLAIGGGWLVLRGIRYQLS